MTYEAKGTYPRTKTYSTHARSFWRDKASGLHLRTAAGARRTVVPYFASAILAQSRKMLSFRLITLPAQQMALTETPRETYGYVDRAANAAKLRRPVYYDLIKELEYANQRGCESP